MSLTDAERDFLLALGRLAEQCMVPGAPPMASVERIEIAGMSWDPGDGWTRVEIEFQVVFRSTIEATAREVDGGQS